MKNLSNLRLAEKPVAYKINWSVYRCLPNYEGRLKTHYGLKSSKCPIEFVVFPITGVRGQVQQILAGLQKVEFGCVPFSRCDQRKDGVHALRMEPGV